MNVSSRLDAVTVYAKGAVCTRLAKVEGAGVRQVRVGGLPLSMHAGSLRARVVGEGARVLDVRPGWDVELTGETDVAAEQKALEAATADVARLQSEAQRVERDIAELTRLKPVFPTTKPGEPPRSAPVEALLKAAEFVSTELDKRFAARRALNEQLDDARNELELRRRRLSEASAAVRTQRARVTRAAVVTLSEGAADVELAVEYFVPGARWAPSYALRLAKGMTAGTLAMRAAVAQDTGEDWSQVRLSLSTAALDRRTALPELKSLRIGRAQPAPQRSGWREPPPGLEELFDDFDKTWGRRPPPPPAPPATVQPAPQNMTRAGTVKKEKAARRDTGEIAIAAGPPPPMRAAPPPPAAPAAAPAMMRARMSAAAPKSAGLLGAFGGGGAGADDDDELALEGAAAAPMDALLDQPAEPPSAPEPELELGGGLLDYGNLYMPPPQDGRGRLQPQPGDGIAMLAAMRVEVSVVMTTVMAVTQRAGRVESLALPPRAHAPSGGSFDYRYDCAARVDVPSKGEWTLVAVADADVGLEPRYACVPSVEPLVYRTLELHNRSTHALLRGPVDVTLGDEFLLTADLPQLAPGEKGARLGLGVEEAIKVARKTHFKETTGGLLGGSTVLPHDVEIEVNNRLGFDARLEVRERVPISLDEDVKIEEAKVEPAWEKDEGLRDGVSVRGARAWRVTVPAGQKVTLSAQYVVRIPSGKMVVGGNRRS